MLKTFKRIILPIMLAAMLLLSGSGCGGNASATQLDFSFKADSPTDFDGEKAIYINEDTASLLLSAKLSLDGGKVTVKLENSSNGNVVWSESYEESSDFDIEILNIKAKSEYTLKVQALQTKSAILDVASDNKLIKIKEKPDNGKPEK